MVVFGFGTQGGCLAALPWAILFVPLWTSEADIEKFGASLISFRAMRVSLFLLVCLLLSLTSCGPRTITGEIVVVTKAGETVKLAGAAVFVMPLKDVQDV